MKLVGTQVQVQVCVGVCACVLCYSRPRSKANWKWMCRRRRLHVHTGMGRTFFHAAGEMILKVCNVLGQDAPMDRELDPSNSDGSIREKAAQLASTPLAAVQPEGRLAVIMCSRLTPDPLHTI